MEAFNYLNSDQEPALPASDEELLQELGMIDNNSGKFMGDLVRDLNLEMFETSTVVPTAPMGYEIIQGHHNQQQPIVQQQQQGIIAYVDFDSSETETTQYHLSGGYMISHEVLPTPVQEVNAFAPPSTIATQDARQAAGGKSKGRRRETKVKLYQKTEPLATPEEEKRRQNAINAKRNRDRKRNEMQEKVNQVLSLTTERDALLRENTLLKKKCESFESQLKAVCKQFNVPLVFLPQ